MNNKDNKNKQIYKWARRVKKGEPYYEVSTKGDKRISPLIARLNNGYTIEEMYQLKIKGYEKITMDWKVGQHKPPLNGLSEEVLWKRYLSLWVMYFKEHKKLLEELKEKCKDTTITDMFAKSDINQAHALCEILNNEYKKEQEQKELLKLKKI